jgi:hypothetical protein
MGARHHGQKDDSNDFFPVSGNYWPSSGAVVPRAYSMRTRLRGIYAPMEILRCEELIIELLRRSMPEVHRIRFRLFLISLTVRRAGQPHASRTG